MESKAELSGGLLNTAEAARFLRVSAASIRRWNDSGLLPAHRVGRRRERRFAEADLQQFLGEATRSLRKDGPAGAFALSVGGASIPIRTHVGPIYSSDAGRLRLAVPFLADGLRAGQPCFLVATGDVLERYARALTNEGIDFAAATKNKRLSVVGFPGGTVAQAIANWERLFGEALAGGPTVLRVVGEMSCERGVFASDAEMMAYEEAFEVMARRYPAVTLCQYDARVFDGEMLLRALKSHPDMFELHLGGFLN
ncbi:MAG: hypothetical protein NVS1B3_02500 [Candidatus Dormibacteraceae bacterium]